MEYVPVDEVAGELSRWLTFDGQADYITLSGSGEPTLNSRFHEVIQYVRKNSKIKTVLLTNGSLFNIPEVRSGAARAHVVKVSLSAWDQRSYTWVNRPHPSIYFKQYIDGLKRFRDQFHGELWMEVFLVWGMNSTISDVTKIAVLAEQIVPDRIQLNTAVRPPAEDFVEPVPRDNIAALCDLFRPAAEVIADFNIEKDIKIQTNRETILSMLKRRPCTAKQIAGAFGMHLNEVLKYLGDLTSKKQVSEKRKNGELYFTAVKIQG